ncbi:LFG3 protein, partial [Spelaeornis formosus]|nr:LFG3 protein [Elachura formosa]
MSQPTAPPLYNDKNPLYPPPPGGYPQPPHYAGGYPQPGGYPAGAGYAQPGGYPASGGYPHPGMAMPTMPMRFVSATTGDNDLGDGSPFQSVDWDDKKVRHSFIRKVYAIISLQLLVTVGIIAVFTFVHPVRSFVQRNAAIYYASYAVFLVTYLVLACCQGPRRRFPWNIILLTIFVSGLGLEKGPVKREVTFFVCSMYQTKAVLIAMLITAIVAIVVTIFCFQTKARRGMHPALPSVGQVWGAGQTCPALPAARQHLGSPCSCSLPVQVPWLHMLYAAIGAIAFTLFLAYDTQLVLGNRKNTLNPEEYIYGALTIYTDIVYIFTFILQIVGRD